MSLTKRLAGNTLANYLGTIVVFVTSLFLVPFTINTLGTTEYGIWALILSTFGFLGLIDFGLANALAKYTAEYNTRNDQQTVDSMTSTLFFVFAGIGAIVFLGITAFSFRFAQFFDVSPQYAVEAQIAIVIFAVRIGLSLPLSVYNAITVGHQRYLLLNTGVAINQIITLVLTVVLLTAGWGIVGLAVAQLVTAITQPVWLRWMLKRQANIAVHIRPSTANRALLAIMLSYSTFMFITMLSAQLESSAGPIIVGRMVSIDAVTSYSIGVKVGSLVRQFTFPMATALFPAFSALYALKDSQRLSLLLTQSLRASVIVTLPAVGITFVLAAPLISVWIGPEYASSAVVARIMVLEALVLQLMMTSSSLLLGTGDLKLYSALHAMALVASVTLGIFAAPRWGDAGVAMASLLAWSLVLLVTIPYTARIAQVRVASVLTTAFIRPFLALVVACLGLLALREWHYPDNFLSLALEAGSAGLVYLLLVWGFCLTAEEKARFLNYVRSFALRFGPNAGR